jgi:hypothetical protein
MQVSHLFDSPSHGFPSYCGLDRYNGEGTQLKNCMFVLIKLVVVVVVVVVVGAEVVVVVGLVVEKVVVVVVGLV